MVFASMCMFRNKKKFIARSASKNTFASSIVSRIASKLTTRIASRIIIVS
jgi:hypothetical protein